MTIIVKTLEQVARDMGEDSEELQWLRPGEWERAVGRLRRTIESCRNEAGSKMVKNVLDPFWLASFASVARLNEARLMSAAMDAHSGRCIANAVGAFHQDVLAGAKGWRRGDGYDMRSDDNRPGGVVVAELKNKHNTVKKSDRHAAIVKLNTQRQTLPKARAYFVEIIPKHPERYCREVSGMPHTFECDGATFYALVSGRRDALREVLDALMKCLGVEPDVVEYLRKLNVLP